jgi:hypothetical protein
MSPCELARKLVLESKRVYNVDPYLLMALVVPKRDLINGVPWGEALHGMVKKILGDTGYVLSEVVCEVQRSFLDQTPLTMDGEAICGWKKADVVEQFDSKTLSCPVLFQILSEKGKRRHVGYSNIQDALIGYMHIMSKPKVAGFSGGCIQLMECPLPQLGNLTKFYVDVDCKLDRLDMKQEDALAMLLEMPTTLGKIFVDLRVIHRTERFGVVVKENSRRTSDGNVKMSIHFIFNLISTIPMFVTLQGLIRAHIRKNCPRCIVLQEDDKQHVTAEDVVDMGYYACMAFADCHPEINSKQGLAGPWSRKSVELPTVSTLREIIWVQNGKVASREVGDPNIFLPYGVNSTHPKLVDVGKGLIVLADTLVSIAGPRCKGFLKDCVMEQVCRPLLQKSPKRKQLEGGIGMSKLLRVGSDSSAAIWAATPLWFADISRKICDGVLPPLTLLQNHLGYPVGVDGDSVDFMFQTNQSSLCICARSMIQQQGNWCKTCHIHKNNGSVYLCSGTEVYVVCRDAECERAVKMGSLYNKKQKIFPVVNTDDTNIGVLRANSDVGVVIDSTRWVQSRGGVCARYVWLHLSSEIMQFINTVVHRGVH